MTAPSTASIYGTLPLLIGDVDRAYVVLLLANGGFHPDKTPLEYPDGDAVAAHIGRLHDPKPVKPSEVSPYYDAANYGDLIESGQLAVVNVVAYRSRKISKERWNKLLAERLPSTLIHRRWLREELIPDAIAGKRRIVFRRNRLWKIYAEEFNHPNILFATRSANLPNILLPDLEWIKRAIAQRQ